MNKVSRRTILQGIGATLTLPWMESLARAGGDKSQARPPVRFGALVFANGVNPYEWWAKGNRRRHGAVANARTAGSITDATLRCCESCTFSTTPVVRTGRCSATCSAGLSSSQHSCHRVRHPSIR